MRNFFLIFKREFAALFLSPVAYATLIVFLLAESATFCLQVVRGVNTSQQLSYALLESIMGWLTIVIAAISLRFFAEEKRSGTFEVTMTAPVTEAQVVWGKYLAGYLFVLIASVAGMAPFFVLRWLSGGIRTIDYGLVVSGMIFAGCVAALLLSVGMVVSLLTNRPAVAVLGTFALGWGILLLGSTIAAFSETLAPFGEYISVLEHLRDFSLGVVDARPLVLYFSCTLFFLFLSVRILESRKWR